MATITRCERLCWKPRHNKSGGSEEPPPTSHPLSWRLFQSHKRGVEFERGNEGVVAPVARAIRRRHDQEVSAIGRALIGAVIAQVEGDRLVGKGNARVVIGVA